MQPMRVVMEGLSCATAVFFAPVSSGPLGRGRPSAGMAKVGVPDNRMENENRNNGELKQKAYFLYDENKALLDVRYDAQANEVVIRGGRHGYAHFAELCSIYAELSVEWEDHHWHELRGGEHAFTIILQNGLTKAQ